MDFSLQSSPAIFRHAVFERSAATIDRSASACSHVVLPGEVGTHHLVDDAFRACPTRDRAIFRLVGKMISVAFRSSVGDGVAVAILHRARESLSRGRFSTFFRREWRKPCRTRLSRCWSNSDQNPFGSMDVQLKDACKPRRPRRAVVPGGSRPVGRVDFMIEIN
ncbi:hypothetical protein [Rhodanobacter sp. Root561]|uniref:hypothetical protein n=1 Tax=Rhodanobacter sp. Root561 TaxID=1736560 RepID=UPI0012F9FCEC|nr:hypothetical protein [Rhodanobacter sp. Root561]